MSVGTRIAATAVAGIATLALAVPAQATTSVFIYTYPTSVKCHTVGTAGVSASVFANYTCLFGFAGYSLNVEPTGATFSEVYLDTYDTSTNANFAGANGATSSPKTWGSYRLRPGIAGWDLLVSSV
ncbi:hypothetical protein [Actinokineospora sp. NBRC 105648]|uniref:hypothetical protein n=1 Tax=Actinokineospora sp. NBRC 105648 TaxID=3032206 RepID=UPI0024A1ADD3|nr:hypothetical protein [Actinokineospora sp. NBRC 105648]GLZ41528.1 hypothetical protein Acsp05_51520 [Actinokineospora sp. NBRC 105648]